MRQQLNLNDPRYTPQPVRFSARQVGLGLAALVITMVLTQGGLLLATRQAEAAARERDTAMGPLRSRLVTMAAPALEPGQGPGQANELPTLKAVEAAQRRVRAALESGVAGSREGPAGYFSALARQSSGAVWITGLTISEDGRAVDLDGRMLDTADLTAYLRRLNAEPRFRGRPFSQLQLHTGEAPGSAGSPATSPAGGPLVTDFALRSSGGASGAGT